MDVGRQATHVTKKVQISTFFILFYLSCLYTLNTVHSIFYRVFYAYIHSKHLPFSEGVEYNGDEAE